MLWPQLKSRVWGQAQLIGLPHPVLSSSTASDGWFFPEVSQGHLPPPWGQPQCAEPPATLTFLGSAEVPPLCLPGTWQGSAALTGKVSTVVKQGTPRYPHPHAEIQPDSGAHPESQAGPCPVNVGSGHSHLPLRGTGQDPPNSALDTKTDPDGHVPPSSSLCPLSCHLLTF